MKKWMAIAALVIAPTAQSSWEFMGLTGSLTSDDTSYGRCYEDGTGRDLGITSHGECLRMNQDLQDEWLEKERAEKAKRTKRKP